VHLYLSRLQARLAEANRLHFRSSPQDPPRTRVASPLAGNASPRDSDKRICALFREKVRGRAVRLRTCVLQSVLYAVDISAAAQVATGRSYSFHRGIVRVN
jgi:hypothetical protein